MLVFTPTTSYTLKQTHYTFLYDLVKNQAPPISTTPILAAFSHPFAIFSISLLNYLNILSKYKSVQLKTQQSSETRKQMLCNLCSKKAPAMHHPSQNFEK